MTSEWRSGRQEARFTGNLPILESVINLKNPYNVMPRFAKADAGAVPGYLMISRESPWPVGKTRLIVTELEMDWKIGDLVSVAHSRRGTWLGFWEVLPLTPGRYWAWDMQTEGGSIHAVPLHRRR